MINSFKDHPTAYHQLVTMVCLLQSKGLVRYVDYDYLTIPGTHHSFAYWNSWDHRDTPTQLTVGEDVIQFLKVHAGLL